ncbi:hypothetical protein AVO45_06685 [Ruegeria marisrubri]|uniref:Uncharacterized protein n=2 Tax=Ruegeria marisrubri TaxID=1685379 RepID=A0A0X3TY72_9RHOB|nr:hypothetical protein AVO45_06685 [Ruegeria marisrubri]
MQGPDRRQTVRASFFARIRENVYDGRTRRDRRNAMTLRTLACAVAVGLFATAASACELHKQTQSCAPGTVWDSESQSCVKAVNS